MQGEVGAVDDGDVVEHALEHLHALRGRHGERPRQHRLHEGRRRLIQAMVNRLQGQLQATGVPDELRQLREGRLLYAAGAMCEGEQELRPAKLRGALHQSARPAGKC